jgi:hypothetical protein
MLASNGASYAQAPMSMDALDQSLLNSEPVEEAPLTPQDTVTKNPSPSQDTTAEEKFEPSIVYDIAVLQGLKKVSAETSVFEVPLDTQVDFGTLTITVKKCVKSAPGERPENTALLLIKDNKPGEEPVVAFSGWMFSSSPAISALEHPVYDITMLDCKLHDAKKPADKTKK